MPLGAVPDLQLGGTLAATVFIDSGHFAVLRGELFEIWTLAGEPVAAVDLGARLTSAVMDGSTAWLTGNGLWVQVDVAEPSAPAVLANGTIAHFTAAGLLSPGRVLGYRSGGVGVLDFSVVPPVLVNIGGAASLASLGDDLAAVFFWDRTELAILDLADPTAPVELGTLPGGLGVIGASGNSVYASEGQTLRVIDVSVPADPAVRGAGTLGASANSGAADGSLLWVGRTFQSSQLWDVSDADAPVMIGTYASEDAVARIQDGAIVLRDAIGWTNTDAAGFASAPPMNDVGGSVAAVYPLADDELLVRAKGSLRRVALDPSGAVMSVSTIESYYRSDDNPSDIGVISEGGSFACGQTDGGFYGGLSCTNLDTGEKTFLSSAFIGTTRVAAVGNLFVAFNQISSTKKIHIARAVDGVVTEVFSSDIAFEVTSLALVGTQLFLRAFGNGSEVWDLADPANPVIAPFDATGKAKVTSLGGLLYTESSGVVSAYDPADLATPLFVSEPLGETVFFLKTIGERIVGYTPQRVFSFDATLSAGSFTPRPAACGIGAHSHGHFYLACSDSGLRIVDDGG